MRVDVLLESTTVSERSQWDQRDSTYKYPSKYVLALRSPRGGGRWRRTVFHLADWRGLGLRSKNSAISSIKRRPSSTEGSVAYTLPLTQMTNVKIITRTSVAGT